MEPREPPQIFAGSEQLAGVWANHTSVIAARHEFTIDFARLDAAAPPPGRGVLVARVAVSPALALELGAQLQAAWASYARREISREVGDDDPELHDPEA